MPHANRSRRREVARLKQKPVKPEEQQRRAAERADARRRRYPQPPAYRYSHAEPPPVQPLCYASPWQLAKLLGRKAA